MKSQCLLASIQEQIRNNPKAVAVIHEQHVITYQDLGNLANRLAHYLHDYPVRQGSRIALYMRRSYEVLIAILAIWKLDAAYLPIDSTAPWKRVKQILDEAEPDCIISEPALLEKIIDQNIPVLTLQDPAIFNYPIYFNEISSTLNITVDKENNPHLAYIIYTSGSTGIPKGVMISHDNLKNHLTWLIETFQFDAKDVFSFNSPLAFDFSVSCMIAPLVVGARIIITSQSNTLDLKRYCDQLVENKVTFVKWTPSYFKLLVEYVEKYKPDLSSFRYIMVAGEELLTHYVARWFNVYPSHRIINEYGPTETCVGITAHFITKETLNTKEATVPIGKPIINSQLYVVDTHNHLCKKGEIGELLIGGASVACGYYKRPDFTATRFINGLYKTGDLVKQLLDDSYLYVGRIDHQVKINGYRVELYEIEYRLLQHASIKQTVVTTDHNEQHIAILVAYIVLKDNKVLDSINMRDYLSQYLPHYAVPKYFYVVSHIPLTINGKIDYAQLPQHILKPHPEKITIHTSHKVLKQILYVLDKYVQCDTIDVKNSFFSLGVTSLLAARIVTDINQMCGATLKIIDLFHSPTPLALAHFLEEQQKNMNSHTDPSKLAVLAPSSHEDIAIIAMECRYPGADNCEELWDICREGKECITFFDADPSSVGARGILNNIEYFDAEFFHYSPKEAHFSDPQHRLFLESAWIALEKAGYAPGSAQLGKVGVYVSMADSTYVFDHGLAQFGENYFPDHFSLRRLMSPQFLATKVAYQLNCTGPSLSVQTACSSSLVSVALACQQLSSYCCDVALAGGVSMTTPQDKPYTYQLGNIFSPDGHCRPFDAQAKGTVFSNGLGVVVLKRLADALRDNDTIVSVIKGVSINNDGADKMSYTAPSIQGQVECIVAAQTIAGVSADSIQYVEAHGTGTLVGDPIEIEALTIAFRSTSYQQQFCALGAIKANIGHTYVAAGVAGLIKTALALQHREIPPAVNYTQSNPHIDFSHSPFYMNTRLQYWPRQQQPRRAAVSAFGVGGTNAHVILEEAPEPIQCPTGRQYHALLLSAKSLPALTEYHDKLIKYLEQAATQLEQQAEQQTLLADVAYTLQLGRQGFQYRSSIISDTIAGAIIGLKEAKDRCPVAIVNERSDYLPVIFLFPGLREPCINLSLELYRDEVIYRECVDRCLAIASTYIHVNLKDILLAGEKNTEFTHPILFSIEYALAQLLISFQIRPDMMLGHGLGDYVAACISGVLSLEDALQLVCARSHAITTGSVELLQSTLQSITRKSPTIPYLSNLTGDWMTEEEIQQDDYWIEQLSATVQLSTCVLQRVENPRAIFIAVGPGTTVFSSLQQHTQYPLHMLELNSNRQVLETLQQLWNDGYSIDWSQYYRQEKRRRIPLPTYPFQRKRYWFDEVINNKNTELGYYAPTWVRDSEAMQVFTLSPLLDKKRRWIIFSNGSVLVQQAIDHLNSVQAEVIIIERGQDFANTLPHYFIIDPMEPTHYLQLFGKIVTKEINDYAILHFWSMDLHQFHMRNQLLDDPVLYQGLYSGIFIAKALSHLQSIPNISCVWVTSQVHTVLGDEPIDPLKSCILSVCRVLPLEYPNMRCVNIDVECKDLELTDIANQNNQLYSGYIVNTALHYLLTKAQPVAGVSALRKQYRWCLQYQSIDPLEKGPLSELKSGLTLVRNGVYLITGGLGGMGLTVANWLSSQESSITIVLISRTPFPQPTAWQTWEETHHCADMIYQKIQRLKQIIGRGSRVIIKSGDVADYSFMKQTLGTIEQPFSFIKGCFSLAGVAGKGLAALKEVNDVHAVLSPKIQGTEVLARLLRWKKLDFVCCASSLTAIAGGVGQIDYCAANIFLDSFMALRPFKNCQKYLTINWNAWSAIGMAAHFINSKTQGQLYAGNSISPEEGVVVLDSLLNSVYTQVVVSRFSPENEVKRIVNTFNQVKPLDNLPLFCDSPYESREKIYDRVVQAWKDILGVSTVHDHDDFYSLGGDSLLLIQLLWALQKQFRIDLTLCDLTHASTLNLMVKLIECQLTTGTLIASDY